MTPTEKAIALFIQELVFPGRSMPLLQRDQSLLDGDLLDSFGLHHLVEHIDANHGVQLREEHFSPTHFATIGTLAALVDSLRGTGR
jgi:acyl carrier protein